MIIVGTNRIDAFVRKHVQARKPLMTWIRKTKNATWTNSADVKATFTDVDNPGGFYIFNIAYNKYRLVVIIKFVDGIVAIQEVMTHADYNRWCAKIR